MISPTNLYDAGIYKESINEFDKLLANAENQTLVVLISKAKELTEKSLKMLLRIHNATTLYSNERNRHIKQKIQQLHRQKNFYKGKIKKLKSDTASETLCNSLDIFSEMYLVELDKKIELENDVSSLVLRTCSYCSQEFNTVLLQLILKPGNSGFEYSTAINILDCIATKTIPVLEDLKTIFRLPISIKQKQFSGKTDSATVYLRQYADVLGKWIMLATAFVEIMENHSPGSQRSQSHIRSNKKIYSA